MCDDWQLSLMFKFMIILLFFFHFDHFICSVHVAISIGRYHVKKHHETLWTQA